MEIREKAYRDGPNSWECRIGKARLVIAADFGPRILHLSVGDGPNILFVDEKRRISRGEWFLYGGHRLWIAPETASTYASDNDPCAVDAKDDRVTVTATDERQGIEKSITISEQNGNFLVDHTVVNRGETLVTGALWALTCVLPKGTAFFPWGTGGEWDLKKVVYWHSWMDHRTDMKSRQYVPTDDLFLVRPTGDEGKVGTSGHGGLVGITAEDYTFIKRFDRHPTAPYTDEGCAVECYTCADFIELETLSPLATFFPGVPVSHAEEWIVAGRPVDPEDGDAVRRLLTTA